MTRTVVLLAILAGAVTAIAAIVLPRWRAHHRLTYTQRLQRAADRNNGYREGYAPPEVGHGHARVLRSPEQEGELGHG